MIASAHVVMSEPYYNDYTSRVQLMHECLCAYGIHSATLQPELVLESGQTHNNNNNNSKTEQDSS